MVMIEIYCVSAAQAYERLYDLLSRHIPAPFEILRSPNGKPYVKGNPVHFSLSHSGDRGIIALSSSPVGIDLEIFKHKSRQSVYSRFTERERGEISGEKDFLRHWTAREAYIKFLGLTVAEMWKRIEFFGGNILLDGEIQKIKLRFYDFYYGVAAVCVQE